MSKISCVRSSLKRIRDPVVRERLLMVQAAYEMSLRDAAAKFGCTHGKVDFWKQRYEQEGVRGLYTRERSGRPPKINYKQRSKLRRIVRKHNAMKGWRTRGGNTRIDQAGDWRNLQSSSHDSHSSVLESVQNKASVKICLLKKGG